MGQTVDQIEDEIEDSREDLRSNLAELGHKARSAVDWRERFRAHPGAVLAVAFGAGFILANLYAVSPGRPGRPEQAGLPRRAAGLTGAAAEGAGRAMRAWEGIQTALVGMVAAKVSDTLADVIPGFKEQLKRTDLVGAEREVKAGSAPH
jgi:hypothetical protein